MSTSPLVVANKTQDLLDFSRNFDFIAPLLLRLYLAPIFWMAGIQKYNAFDSTAAWFGNADWGLGLPFPELLTALVVAAELGGAVLLTFGLATRWVCVPLIVTMIVAAQTVHLDNGWLAISSGDGIFSSERTVEAVERLDRAKEILKTHGNYKWLTEHGSLVMLNNGIEFAATYILMLLVLFFMGAGRYFSLDYWIAKRFREAL
ncbi:MAG: hypothetical protein COB04_14610 [Gammaproteobacteria bacterium]|nr:MAG: hypothetical protein COB04_14610 [Gammaproteobacteria bacterium]